VVPMVMNDVRVTSKKHLRLVPNISLSYQFSLLLFVACFTVVVVVDNDCQKRNIIGTDRMNGHKCPPGLISLLMAVCPKHRTERSHAREDHDAGESVLYSSPQKTINQIVSPQLADFAGNVR
jgi:hypothetical protein